MGTPVKTATATTPTKKISRFRLPRSWKTGWSRTMPATSTPTKLTAPSTRRQLPTSARRSTADRIMKPMPTGSAAARQTFGISSAGVVIKLSSEANSKAGSMTRSRKASAAQMATTSRKARTGGETLPTRAVIRMCSPRWNATTAPSMASQRNSIEANSSDQTIGWVEDVAGDDAGEQDADLGDDQQRRRDLDHGPEHGVERRRPVLLAEGKNLALQLHGRDVLGMGHGTYTSLPETCSRLFQASSPYLAFQSR